MWEKTVDCYYCGMICEGTGTRDHRYPHALIKSALQGHKNNSSRRSTLKGNMVFACPMCNTSKGNMTEDEFKLTKYYRTECATGKWKGFILRR